jgi:hypothetical protein
MLLLIPLNRKGTGSKVITRGFEIDQPGSSCMKGVARADDADRDDALPHDEGPNRLAATTIEQEILFN